MYYTRKWHRMEKVRDLYYLWTSLFRSIEEKTKGYDVKYGAMYIPRKICTIKKNLPQRVDPINIEELLSHKDK